MFVTLQACLAVIGIDDVKLGVDFSPLNLGDLKPAADIGVPKMSSCSVILKLLVVVAIIYTFVVDEAALDMIVLLLALFVYHLYALK